MTSEIVINAAVGETRVGIIERNQFTELHIERDDERNVAGAVVKGRVTRVLPGMQAAFVDIGLEKAAFLYAGDYYDDSAKSNGNNGARNPTGPQTMFHPSFVGPSRPRASPKLSLVASRKPESAGS